MKKKTNHHQPTIQPSLRTLAAELGCTHSALSGAFRAGRLRAGLVLDKRGRIVVTDARAAADEWSSRLAPVHLAQQEQARATAWRSAAGASVRGDDYEGDLLDQALSAVIVASLRTSDDMAAAARDLAARAAPHCMDAAAVDVLEAAIEDALKICLVVDNEPDGENLDDHNHEGERA